MAELDLGASSSEGGGTSSLAVMRPMSGEDQDDDSEGNWSGATHQSIFDEAEEGGHEDGTTRDDDVHEEGTTRDDNDQLHDDDHLYENGTSHEEGMARDNDQLHDDGQLYEEGTTHDGN